MRTITELDLSHPFLPDDIIRFSDEETGTSEIKRALDDAWLEVLKELQDAKFSGRTHHSTGTYEAGCRGPLCRKAHRENPRRRTQDVGRILAPRLERRLDPVLEYYHTVAKVRIRAYQLELLEAIKKG